MWKWIRHYLLGNDFEARKNEQTQADFKASYLLDKVDPDGRIRATMNGDDFWMRHNRRKELR